MDLNFKNPTNAKTVIFLPNYDFNIHKIDNTNVMILDFSNLCLLGRFLKNKI